MKECEGEEDDSSEEESPGSLNLQEKEGHRCQKCAGSDISYVSDAFSKPDRGVFTAEPLRAVTIFCCGVHLGRYILQVHTGIWSFVRFGL
jgi:hypothetical protein